MIESRFDAIFQAHSLNFCPAKLVPHFLKQVPISTSIFIMLSITIRQQ